MDQQTAQKFEKFTLENRAALEEMASALRSSKIAQVQFGLDFNSDEPALSEYALWTYDDGTIKETHEWPEELDGELLLWLPSGSGAYIFDAVNVTITQDPTGGLVWMLEDAAQVYHSEARRLLLEAEATEAQAEVEALIAQYEAEQSGNL